MELSKINVEIRERIKEVLGLNDGSLVKMNENDLLNELLDTIEFFDDEEKNKFLPRIRTLTTEAEALKAENAKLKDDLKKSASSAPKEQVVVKAEQAPASTTTASQDLDDEAALITKEAEDLYEKTKKQISSFLKKKFAVVENGDLENIHPKQKDLEEEVLKLAKENSELNTLIMDDMDLIDSLMVVLKKNEIEWKHTMIEKRSQKVKAFAASYQPFGRLFLYKKLLSVPQLELVKDK